MRGISWVMKEIRSRNASSYSLQMLRIWNSRKILLIPSSRVSLVFWISLSRVLPSILTVFACLWWLSSLCSVLELQLLAKLIITIRLQCKYSGLVMPATLLSDQTRVTHQTHTLHNTEEISKQSQCLQFNFIDNLCLPLLRVEGVPLESTDGISKRGQYFFGAA